MATNQDWQQPPPPKPGMSGAAKVLIALGVGGGLLLLVCVGLCGGVGYFFRGVVPTTDPATINERTQEIAGIQTPPEVVPGAAMEVATVMSIITYNGVDGASSMTLAEKGANAAELDQASFRMQVDIQVPNLRMQTNLPPIPEVLIDPGTVQMQELTVRGQPAEFSFGKGKQAGSDVEYWEVSGEFIGKNDRGVLLILVLPAETYTQEELVEWIEGIQ